MFKNYLSGPNGEKSAKRLFTAILMFLWVVYFFANLFWGYSLKPTFEDQLFYMILVMYAGVALEGWKEVFKTKTDPLILAVKKE